MSDAESTPKMTPEEHEILAHSPADSPNLVDGEPDSDPPEGVVGDDDRPPAE